jgi:hypothetical protein
MCREAYTETVDNGTPWFSRYTDNCDCHNDHEAEEEQALWDTETQTWKG